jgi:hypothetical protein
MPTDDEHAPLVQLVAATDTGTETPFRVLGYSGRITIGETEYVLTDYGVIESISPLLNSTLALSSICVCEKQRPYLPDIDAENNIALSFFFRLVGIVAQLLPCCEQDTRLSETEETNNWYAAVCTIVRFIEDFYLALPKKKHETNNWDASVCPGVVLQDG